MSDGDFGSTGRSSGIASEGPAETPKPASPRDRIIEATMELAAEREWNDFTLADVARRAGLSLADFRDAFPSKGAVLAGLSKKIDRVVLEGTDPALSDEPAKERLFDILIRRLDAMAPYKLGLESVSDWVRRDPMAAAALNRVALNSMRFMLEAAEIDTERGAGPLKIQGLVLAWARVLDVWFKDEDAGLARTMATLDRELTRGEKLAARVDDLDRLVSPLRLLARRAFTPRRGTTGDESRPWRGSKDDTLDPAVD